ncbi:MAG: GcrA family cell cycle regulator [Bdellovibrionales bacterium]
MSWTEQKIEMLKEMWGHGYSASEIAKQLGGLTRNAVIGKAHRLKLSVRGASPRIEAKSQQRGVAASSVTSALSASSNQGAGSVKSSSRKRVMLRPLPSMPLPTEVPSHQERASTFHALDSIKRSEGISVTKAGDRQCRWPVGDPRSPDFRFCGCPAYESLPYCIDHARVAYQNVGRKARAAVDPMSESRGSQHARY